MWDSRSSGYREELESLIFCKGKLGTYGKRYVERRGQSVSLILILLLLSKIHILIIYLSEMLTLSAWVRIWALAYSNVHVIHKKISD